MKIILSIILVFLTAVRIFSEVPCTSFFPSPGPKKSTINSDPSLTVEGSALKLGLETAGCFIGLPYNKTVLMTLMYETMNKLQMVHKNI